MSNKQLALLIRYLPLAVYLFIILPIIFLWPRPHVPVNGTAAQHQQWMQDFDRSIQTQGGVVIGLSMVSLLVAVAGSTILEKRRKLGEEVDEPSEKVNVRINAKWHRIAYSPLFLLVAALQGIACTACPLFLYMYGKWSGFSGKPSLFSANDLLVLGVCMAITYGVAIFYYSLGGEVIGELRKQPLPYREEVR